MTLLAAIHGILTSQTDPSWPDRLDSWISNHAPDIKVLKKEYRAGPFPRLNCFWKDPLLARSLANEIELFLSESSSFRCSACFQPAVSQASSLPTMPTLQVGHLLPTAQLYNPAHPTLSVSTYQLSHVSTQPAIWFVAHSNGAIIALDTARLLINRGHKIAGLILIGAACDPDITKNGILPWLQSGSLGCAMAYISPDDHLLPEPPSPNIDQHSGIRNAFNWLWSKLIYPYSNLGRTGWLQNGKLCSAAVPAKGSPGISPGLISSPLRPWCPFVAIPSNLQHRLLTRSFPGGHSTYFTPENRDSTFRQILEDVRAGELNPEY